MEGGEILCDLPVVTPAGTSTNNKPDVQNKWDDNTHIISIIMGVGK